MKTERTIQKSDEEENGQNEENFVFKVKRTEKNFHEKNIINGMVTLFKS